MDKAALFFKVTWLNPTTEPLLKIVRVGVRGNRHADISLAIDLRTVASLEIRPLRRPLADVEGVVEDAERLANEMDEESEDKDKGEGEGEE